MSTEAPFGAFGLALDSDAGLPGLALPSAVAGSRFAEHRLVDSEAIRERCGPGTLTKFGSYGEGSGYCEYHQHASGGELMRTKSFGEHLIADGGRTVLSAVNGAQTEDWERFVLGQVLPVTASIQGLEVFHASAVSLDGGVIALAGPSGVGKSTLAGALIANGAAHFADDALSVDVGVAGITAYSGPGLMALPLPQARELGLEGSIWTADDVKVTVETHGDRGARPIRAFVALTRDADAVTPQFTPCSPGRLMASTFDALPRSPERLRRLLRVCAQLASDARALELRFSTHSEPAEVAESILERLPVEGMLR